MKRAVAWLTVVHRWLGLVFCLIFLSWFASGIVMVFHRMPEYGAGERLARLAPIDAAAVRISPADAARAAGIDEPPQRVVLTTLRGRPVYRFLVHGEWSGAYADDGAMVDPVSSAQAVEIARALFGPTASHAVSLDTIDQPDQWAFEIPFRRTGPLHRVALGDDASTIVYVAQDTGEVVLATDRATRAWGYVGPVTHWFYFRGLRVHGPLWSNLIIYGSLVGCLIALAGLVIGLYRFSASRRFKAGTSASPYVGTLRWHHYAGLAFGVFVLTWTFSGLLSMSPWDWSPGNSPDPDQVSAIRGDGIDLSRFAVTPVTALAAFERQFRPREIEFRQFLGTPFYLAYRPPANAHGEERPLEPTLVQADTGQRRDGFTRGELMRAARTAMPDAMPIDSAWLTDFDAYYYGRRGSRRLPVLRVRFDDPAATWLYLDAHDGSLVQREVRRSRLERWLYHGFHSLDLPGLYQTSLAWYVVIVALMLGGLAVSATSVAVAWRVLRRHV